VEVDDEENEEMLACLLRDELDNKEDASSIQAYEHAKWRLSFDGGGL